MQIRERADGRMYSRILRRAVAIVRSVPSSKAFALSEIAELVIKRKLPDFHLTRFDRQISVDRMRDYIRYVRDLGVILDEDTQYRVKELPNYKTAQEYAQVFSDLALEHLSKLIQKPTPKIPSLLADSSDELLRSKRVPTINSIADNLKIESGRQRELFRWSLYLYADGETSNIEVHRYPIISRKTRGSA